MGFSISPDVVVKETDLTGFSQSVATTGGAFVGQFDWGQVEAFTTITNKKELERVFGKPTDVKYRDWFSASNFLDYSNNLNIIRVVESSALNASVDGAGILIKNETHQNAIIGTAAGDTALVSAKYPGALGDSLKVSICDATTWDAWDTKYKDAFDSAPGTSDFVAQLNGENDEIHIVVVDEDGAFTNTPGAILEVFAYVSKAKDAKRLDGEPSFYGTIVNRQSQYIWFLKVPESVSYAVGGAITGLSVTTPGQDYTSAPSVAITGDGSGATATSILATTGSIKSIAITNGGTGYSVGDAIVITGDGSGATAEVGAETGGVIDTIIVTASGTGYTSATVDATATGGGDATATAVVGFAVASITIDNAGSDYVDATTVVTLTGDGTGVVASATVAPNADYDGEWNTLSISNKFKSLNAPWSVSLSGGSNGGIVSANEIVKGWDYFADAETISVSLLILGDAGGDIDHSIVVKHVADNIADTRKDVMMFYSPKYGDVVNIAENTAVDNVIATRKAVNTVSSYVVMDSTWKYQYDVFNDTYRWIPLNADIAGLCVYTDAVSDPWFSPAGFTRGQIKNVAKLALNPNKTNRDKMYKNSVNPIVSFAGEGTLLYGDKTQLAKPSPFQKINIRRLFITLEKSIANAAKYQLFEFNDSFTRAQFVNMVEPFLREVQGRRGINDFKVICDETNNTLEVIDSSEFVATILIKPAYSINFISLNFVAVRTGVEFDEVAGSV